MSRLFVLISVFSCTIILTVYAFKKSASESRVKENKMVVSSFLKLSPELARKSAEKKVQVLREINQAVRVNVGDESQSSEAKIRLQKVFLELLKNVDFFDREKLENDIFEVLSENSKNVEVVRDLLINPALYSNFYGDTLAEMRAYGVRYLIFEAKKGNLFPSENVVTELLLKLNLNGEALKGQYLDLEELLFGLSQVENNEEPIVRMNALIDKFGIIEKPIMTQNERNTLRAVVSGLSVGFKGQVKSELINNSLVMRFPIFLSKG